jgi:hypothetical protein
MRTLSCESRFSDRVHACFSPVQARVRSFRPLFLAIQIRTMCSLFILSYTKIAQTVFGYLQCVQVIH